MKAPKRELTEYQIVIQNLKELLKRQKRTYRELAEGVGLSESGMKKIFAARDGSFERLTQICRFVGVSLTELLENQQSLPVEFTPRQQAAFLKEPLLFQVFWMLVYERQSIEVVKAELRLSHGEAFKVVRRLDVLGMLKLLPGEKIRVPTVKAIHWVGDGEFQQKMYRDWSLALVRDVAGASPAPDQFFILRYLQMTPKTYQEFKQAHRHLEEEFIRRSIQEMRLQLPGLGHVRVLVALDTKSFVTG